MPNPMSKNNKPKEFKKTFKKYSDNELALTIQENALKSVKGGI